MTRRRGAWLGVVVLLLVSLVLMLIVRGRGARTAHERPIVEKVDSFGGGWVVHAKWPEKTRSKAYSIHLRVEQKQNARTIVLHETESMRIHGLAEENSDRLRLLKDKELRRLTMDPGDDVLALLLILDLKDTDETLRVWFTKGAYSGKSGRSVVGSQSFVPLVVRAAEIVPPGWEYGDAMGGVPLPTPRDRTVLGSVTYEGRDNTSITASLLLVLEASHATTHSD